jgi:hypothetical protein
MNRFVFLSILLHGFDFAPDKKFVQKKLLPVYSGGRLACRRGLASCRPEKTLAIQAA